MVKKIQVNVSGKVQGVGFRWCSYEKFVELGLTGTAENMPDGTIQVFVEGEVENLKKFLAWAKHGPEGAKVSNMEYREVVMSNE